MSDLSICVKCSDSVSYVYVLIFLHVACLCCYNSVTQLKIVKEIMFMEVETIIQYLHLYFIHLFTLTQLNKPKPLLTNSTSSILLFHCISHMTQKRVSNSKAFLAKCYTAFNIIQQQYLSMYGTPLHQLLEIR